MPANGLFSWTAFSPRSQAARAYADLWQEARERAGLKLPGPAGG